MSDKDPSDISQHHHNPSHDLSHNPGHESAGFRKSVTRSRVIVFVVVLVLCGLSFWGGSQYQKDKKTTTTSSTTSTQAPSGQGFGGRARRRQRGLLGTVTAISSTSISVKNSRTGDTSALSIDSNTTVTSGGQTTSVSDIKVGDTVIVRPSSSNSTTAGSIILNPQIPGASNPAPTTTPSSTPSTQSY